jgi:glycosyltransferase involved in cell wall biosynthesis
MSSRRRIAYIHHGYGIGGATLSLLYLVEKLDRARYEPVVACLYDGPAAHRYREAGLAVVIAEGVDHFGHSRLAWHSLRRPDVLLRKVLSFWPSALRTERLVRRLEADLVHLNTSGLPASAIGARRAGVPVVWHVREPIHHGYTGLRRAVLRRLIHEYSDRVVAICHDNARQLWASDRVRVIYNFVDFARFDRALYGTGIRRVLGLGDGTRIVLMLGGVAIPKGTLPLLTALPAVLDHVPDANVVIAGNLPMLESGWRGRLSRIQSYRRRVDQFVAAHSLSSHVHFVGVRDDVPQLLAASDLLVFPSVVPHFARPIIEAGAMAKPVVASDLGGPDELVVHGETGLLVPAGDPAALADAIVQVLAHPERAQSMGEAGYARARRLYNADINAARTIALYDELFDRSDSR